MSAGLFSTFPGWYSSGTRYLPVASRQHVDLRLPYWPEVSVRSSFPASCTHSQLLLAVKQLLLPPLCCSLCPTQHEDALLTSPSLCVSVRLPASPQEKEGGHPAEPGGPALLHHRRGPGEDPSAQVHHSESTKQHIGLRIRLMLHSVRIYGGPCYIWS